MFSVLMQRISHWLLFFLQRHYGLSEQILIRLCLQVQKYTSRGAQNPSLASQLQSTAGVTGWSACPPFAKSKGGIPGTRYSSCNHVIPPSPTSQHYDKCTECSLNLAHCCSAIPVHTEGSGTLFLPSWGLHQDSNSSCLAFPSRIHIG